MPKYVWIADTRAVFNHGMPSRGTVLDLSPDEAAALLAEGKVEPHQPQPTAKPVSPKGKE